MRFRPKDKSIREKIAPLRANHIARITSDFKLDMIKGVIAGVISKRTSAKPSEITSTITAESEWLSVNLIRSSMGSIESFWFFGGQNPVPQ